MLTHMSTDMADGADDQTITYSRRRMLATIGGSVTVGGLIAGALGSGGVSSIETWDELASLTDADGDYRLEHDLDDSVDGYDSHVDDPPDGWEPIDGFTGYLDGNGRTIADLVIDRPSETPVGLFGYLDDAIIEDLAFLDATIFGGDSTGVVCGDANSSSLSAIGVFDATVEGDDRVGGVVGSSSGLSLTKAAVSGTVRGDLYAGGLVGYASGVITDGYALSTVESDDTAGGLAGFSSADIARGYAGGSVVGDAEAGGLIGEHFGLASIEDAYWDIGMTGQVEAVGNDSVGSSVIGHGSVGDSEPAIEMLGRLPLPEADGGDETMPALDFDEVWAAVIEDEPIGPTPTADGYPVLQGLDATIQLDAQGIGTNPNAGALISIEAGGSVSVSNVTVGDDGG